MTFNEEGHLGTCLQSMQGLGKEIYILDSGSTDRTVEIARLYGARVEVHPFDSYKAQRSRLLQGAACNYVLCLDADEYLSPELRASILEVTAAKGVDGYYVNRRSRIGDRWIRHGSWYPDRKLRFFDRRKVEITGRDPHEVIAPIKDSTTAFLQGDLLHLADDHLSSRFRTIEKHSTRAAKALYDQRKKASIWRILCKPFLRFFISYFIKRGFLDGFYGYIVAKSEAYYVWMREVKLKELEEMKSVKREA